jgi:hydroxyacylglutathione hydrolase
MIVERSMHPGWLSNAYLVADEPGGKALFVDSGAPLDPLLAAVERDGLEPTHLLITHAHGDHVAGNEELVRRFDIPVMTEAVETGNLRVEALPTPGHSDDMVAFVVNGTVCFTGDTLFRDSIGGGDFEQIRSSIMDTLLTLPPETRILPGHTDESTIEREWEENPFVRLVAGLRRQGQGLGALRRRA